jgi:hypothetical protein
MVPEVYLGNERSFWSESKREYEETLAHDAGLTSPLSMRPHRMARLAAASWIAEAVAVGTATAWICQLQVAWKVESTESTPLTMEKNRLARAKSLTAAQTSPA